MYLYFILVILLFVLLTTSTMKQYLQLIRVPRVVQKEGLLCPTVLSVWRRYQEKGSYMRRAIEGQRGG